MVRQIAIFIQIALYAFKRIIYSKWVLELTTIYNYNRIDGEITIVEKYYNLVLI